MKPMTVAFVLALVLGLFGFWALRSRAAPPPALLQSAEAASPDVVQAALAPHWEALEASRRPVVRIRLEAFAADDLLASKLGGRAWWPEGEAPPVGEGGQPLVLLAQLNFAELPASPDYPGRGLLQFFIAADDSYGANFDAEFSPANLSRPRNFRVAFWPDTSGPSQALFTAVDDVYATPHRPGNPRRMRFAADTERLTAHDYRFDRMLGGGAYQVLGNWALANGYGEQVVNGVYEQFDGAGHKFGGYPFFTQTDPRREGPLELLLQLDTDDASDLMWGDTGVGGFFIAPADLARGDFSRVMYTWDCH